LDVLGLELTEVLGDLDTELEFELLIDTLGLVELLGLELLLLDSELLLLELLLELTEESVHSCIPVIIPLLIVIVPLVKAPFPIVYVPSGTISPTAGRIVSINSLYSSILVGASFLDSVSLLIPVPSSPKINPL